MSGKKKVQKKDSKYTFYLSEVIFGILKYIICSYDHDFPANAIVSCVLYIRN